MAKSKVDACIFCGEVPCVCNVKAPKQSQPKKARPPAPKADDTAPPPARTSHLDAMRAAASAAPIRPPVPAEPVRRPIVTQLSDDEIIWNAAVRNLAPLLSESDRELYAGIITSKPHPDEAKIMWKSRRLNDGTA